MRRYAGAVFLTCFLWGGPAFAQDISVSVDYEGRQIQLTGRFESRQDQSISGGNRATRLRWRV
jgi:hypothetical protein